MSFILFLILFIVGVALAIAGSVIGVVQSFQESMTWGLLTLFVPFASLVFLVKFWKGREWVRKSFFMGLGGTALVAVSGVIAAFNAPPMEYGAYSDDVTTEAYATATPDGGTSATYVVNNDPFRDAINLAGDAANRTQTAATKEEWSAIANTWQNSIALLGAVPSTDPNYATAQTKIATYGQNLSYAQQNSK